MKEQNSNKKVITPYNVLNNRMAKVALAASLLLTGVTTTISNVGSSNGIIGEFMEVNRAEAASVFAGGTGTVADPYLVSDIKQLDQIRNHLTSHFKLISDIDLNGIDWVPIGNPTGLFMGSFDGDGHTINGLTMNTVTVSYSGLISVIGQTGIVKNLHLLNVDVESSGGAIGGLAGSSLGQIENVIVSGKVSGLNTGSGGVVGDISGGLIKNVVSQTAVSGKNAVGGIAGQIRLGGSIQNSFSSGTVSATSSQAGGIVGLIAANSTGNILNVYATGDITGYIYAGGLIGQSLSKNISISYGYATGEITGLAIVGGLIGSASGGKYSNLYALNKSVSSSGKGVGKAIGEKESYPTFSTIVAADYMLGNGSSTSITKTITRDESLQKETYGMKGFGFDFGDTGNEAIWVIDEGKLLPYLTFSSSMGITPKPDVPDLEAAANAVVKAEGSKLQVDIDTARDLVSKLPNGEVKTDLTNRLDAIQLAIEEDKALEEAKDAVDNLGDNPTQEEIDAVKDKIDELSDGPAKDIILDQIKEKQDALDQANATKAVEKAETSKTQVDVDAAHDLVKKLSDGSVKTDLTNRLDVIQQAIDLAKQLEAVRSLVNNLGDNPTQGKIDQARLAVEALPDSADKTELHAKVKEKQDALDAKVADARQAVQAISTPPTLGELTNAQDKVDLLPVGEIKTELQKQINEKKKQLDDMSDQLAKAEAAVSKAESFPTSYNVSIATKLVEALPTSDAKTSLQDRLQAIQDIFDLEKAEAKVKQAENYERDPYLADAIHLVDALKDSDAKQALKDRLQVILDKLQAIKDAEEAAKNANGEYNPADPNQTIEDAINTIQDKDAKKYFINWNKAVSNAENFFSKTTVKNATKYLTELPNAYTQVASYENIIKELTERTLNLKEEDTVVDQFATVEKAVANYEKYKTSYYLKKATEAVETLPSGPEKTAFEKRLGLNETNNGSGPTEEEKLAAQLASVEKAVATYEKYKTNFYEKKATLEVDALTDSEAKIAFQARLDAVIK